jgi:hypothetical protein
MIHNFAREGGILEEIGIEHAPGNRGALFFAFHGYIHGGGKAGFHGVFQVFTESITVDDADVGGSGFHFKFNDDVLHTYKIVIRFPFAKP